MHLSPTPPKKPAKDFNGAFLIRRKMFSSNEQDHRTFKQLSFPTFCNFLLVEDCEIDRRKNVWVYVTQGPAGGRGVLDQWVKKFDSALY